MNVNNSINIKAPPKKIWRLLQFDKAHLWLKEKIIYQAENKPLGVGFVFTIKVNKLTHTLEYKGTILDWKPYKKLSLLLQGGMFKDEDMTVHLRLDKKIQHTVLNYKVLMKEQQIASFVAPLTETVGNYGVNKYFENIKELAEQK